MGVVEQALGRIIGRTRTYRVFTVSPTQGRGLRDDDAAVYDREHAPTDRVRRDYRRVAGPIDVHLMLRRLRRHGAVLLVLRRDELMIGYGWLQTWKPLRREFWWLADDAICLGPYWSHPSHRGQGVYGRMLGHSLAECHDRGWRRLYIWADESNAASIRGIEKAGFLSVGRHRVSVGLLGAFRGHAALDREAPNGTPSTPH